jgi:serine/threonine protein kinase
MRGLFKQTNPDKPLGGHYKIISELGVGGFGQTFLAEDLHLPEHHRCVIKQLKPQQRDPKTLEMARRLFDLEAKVLYKLGNHDQIPRLLAHFEDDQEFYLAQELIEGEPLTQELKDGLPWSETQVIPVLRDLLNVLAFVHQQDVIHRDIKPSNLIRRRQDGRIVLIDFGAVKQVSTQIIDRHTGETKTISIGTQGYTPKEQLGGNPRFSSDIYAVGTIAIQALTTIHPRHLTEDPQTGEINWRHHAPQVSPELAAFLDCMVRYDFRARYPTAVEALEALRSISTALVEPAPLNQTLDEATAVFPTPTGLTESGMEESPTLIRVPTEPPSEPPSTANNTGSIEESPTAIWVPTEPPSEPPSTANNTGSMEESPTLIRVPTEPPSEPPSTANNTGSIEESPTAIWVPTEPPVQPPPTVRNTGSIKPVATSQYSKPSESSVPTIATRGLSQRQTVKPWLVLAVLGGVGAAVLMAKILFPQLATQTSDPKGVSTDSPATRSANWLATPFPTRSPAETPTPSTANTAAPPSPASSPVETPTTSPANTPAPPSPTKSPASTQASSAPVPPAAEPTLTSAQPAARPTPTPAQPKASSAPVPPVATPASPRPESKQDDAKDYWERCYSLNTQEQYTNAIAACNQALAINPNYPEALWSKGFALDQQKNHQEALELYKQATDLKPDFAEAWTNQGGALLLLGRPNEAVAAYDKATALKPDLAAAWRDRGAALLELGRVNEAISSINKAIKIDPNDEYAINLLMKAQLKR